MPAESINGRGVCLRRTCKACKEVLRGPSQVAQDVIKKYEGKCPKCKKDLRFSTDGVEVLPCAK
jgi:hypothetical protein